MSAWRPSPEEAERICRAYERERNTPHMLLSLVLSIDAMPQFFEGLQESYFDAMTSGRADKWVNAAHAIVDLLAAPGKQAA